MPHPAERAFAYLVDPRVRPVGQSSLLSSDLPDDEEPHLGQAWTELTVVGARPSLVVVEMAPFRTWAERGTWRGVEATLRLRFTATAGGCRGFRPRSERRPLRNPPTSRRTMPICRPATRR